MLVRYEVDACSTTVSGLASSATTIDALTDRLSGLSVGTSSAGSTVRNGISIVRAGELVPQSSIIEIKSKSAARFTGVDWDDYLPQFVLSGTPRLVIGLHNRGTFASVLHKRSDGDAEVLAERRKLDAKLRLLRKLLGTVIAIAKEKVNQKKKLSLVYRDRVLRLYEKSTTQSCLPQEWMDRFNLKTGVKKTEPLGL